MENATFINQAYPAVVTNDFNYYAWGLSIETLFIRSSESSEENPKASTDSYR